MDAPPTSHLSVKAKALYDRLVRVVPVRESLYIGQLVENAKKRRLIAEELWEKKKERELAREEEEMGVATERFVTSSFVKRRDQVGEIQREMDEREGKKKEPRTRRQDEDVMMVVDPEELKRQRQARRDARRAPPIRTTQQDVEDYVRRARLRLLGEHQS